MAKVLVACEESQRVCTEFRKLGHEAYSCDIIDCSGGHPEWHIKGDALVSIRGGRLTTCDGQTHDIGRWDLIIAHPPCTYLSNVATRQYSMKCCTAEKVVSRWQKRAEAAVFFMQFVAADCEHIAIENPVGFMNSAYRKADQIIHPYFFAASPDDEENYQMKRTCLWLKGLPELEYNHDIPHPEPEYILGTTGKKIYWCEGIKNTHNGQEGRAKARSKTFPGIARAMATQWSRVLEGEYNNV